jgi:Quinohemoprotein amine dehydrogenase, alpha subunit domain III
VIRRLALALLLLAVTAPPAGAYQHLSDNFGPPDHWLHLGIPLTIDNGPTDISSEIADATATWNNVSSAKDPWGTLTKATVDFTRSNFETAWGNLSGDGQQEVVFDETGAALRRLGLAPESVNGLGESNVVVSGGHSVINDMYLIINGSRSSFDRRSTEVHELGHTLGLAHSTVGWAVDKDGALDPELESQVPTMHPYSIAGTERRSLEADDVAALSELYPEASFTTSTGTITGTVTRCGSGDPVLGANVRAINVANPTIQLTRVTGFDGEEDGSYTIHGVPPGEYEIVVEPLAGDADYLDRLAMFTPVDADFPQEFFTPGKESDCAQDTDPEEHASVPVGASGTKTADFKVDSPGLAFVIDVTGSMGPEIAGIKTGLDTMIDNIAAGPFAFPLVTIVTFDDSSAIRTVSRDPARLKEVIAGLTTHSTPDCPEGSNRALMTAGRQLGRGSHVILATDADSHRTGPSRASVDALYASKGLRLNTLLSGSCPPAQNPPRSPRGGPGPDGPPVPFPPGANPDQARPLDQLGPENALRTFSEETLFSGGVFDFRPDVKTGTPDSLTRYSNTLANLGLSAVAPTVAAMTPPALPRATALDVELEGSGTSFGSASTVAVAGTGVSVGATHVLSPTRLTVRLTVAPGAALGFRDVTVTTGSELAKGIGPVEVVGAPSAPAIVSVTPPIVTAGSTRDVTLSGALTHFGGTSVADLGAGVTVNKLTPASATSAVANVTVAAGAAIGFRDVSVQTAGEHAAGGSLLVAPATPAVARLLSVSPDTGARGATLDVALSGANTTFGPTSVANFGDGVTVERLNVSSPAAAVARVHVAPGAALGLRDVIVTTGGQAAAKLDGFTVTRAAPAPPPGPPAGSPAGGGGTGPPATCADASRPSAKVSKAAAKQRKLRVRGRASDVGCATLARVDVAISRKAGRRCRFVTAAGRLTSARKCGKRVFLRAKGTVNWTLGLKRKLPRGRYAIAVRATDKAGNRQAKLATRTLRIR